ncbi:MAG TPA: class I SAM-dependent methyltransferase [Solimonas sp.]
MSASRATTPGSDARGFVFELEESEQGLRLHARHRPRFTPLQIDWTSPEQQRRVAGGKRQLLARAIGLHKHGDLQILDATAGLGRDAWTLAALGARVDLVERQPLLARLLHDALTRALDTPGFATTAQRLRLLDGDAATVLASGQRWDVIHLDPMYPDHNRRALPQKEMQLLRELSGDDADADALLAPARAACRQRVVVKRQLHAPPLAGQSPSFQLVGTQARYDVYLPA